MAKFQLPLCLAMLAVLAVVFAAIYADKMHGKTSNKRSDADAPSRCLEFFNCMFHPGWREFISKVMAFDLTRAIALSSIQCASRTNDHEDCYSEGCTKDEMAAFNRVKRVHDWTCKHFFRYIENIGSQCWDRYYQTWMQNTLREYGRDPHDRKFFDYLLEKFVNKTVDLDLPYCNDNNQRLIIELVYMIQMLPDGKQY